MFAKNLACNRSKERERKRERERRRERRRASNLSERYLGILLGFQNCAPLIAFGYYNLPFLFLSGLSTSLTQFWCFSSSLPVLVILIYLSLFFSFSLSRSLPLKVSPWVNLNAHSFSSLPEPRTTLISFWQGRRVFKLSL